MDVYSSNCLRLLIHTRSSPLEQGTPPQLLNLIPDERDWKVRYGGGRSTFDAEGKEDKELDLRLGLPGIQQHREDTGPSKSFSAVSLARFATHSWLTSKTTRL